MYKFLKILKFAIIATAFMAAFGGVTMWLWNKLVPEIFHGPVLTYWQAIGLLVLSHILFRGGGFRHRGGWHHGRWQQKMAAMSPEEREKFTEKWGKWAGCCPWHQESAHAAAEPKT